MQMDAGLDTGPVLSQRSIPVGEEDDAGSLHDRLAGLGAQMMVEALAEITAGRGRAVPQPREGVTYAAKIGKQETLLDWTRPARELHRTVRAFRPSPGATTRLDGQPIKIWRARVLERPLAPGELRDEPTGELVAGCGEGSLQILELQRAGGKRLLAGEYLRGHPLPPNARLG
jgi:methionyl-tRNA formyltransferase